MSGAVVPIALHVDCWDHIGWKDPYARRVFSLRQRELAAPGGAALVYTPQVRLQGRDFRAWSSQAFDAEVARINAQPARAEISLVVAAPRDDALAVQVAARLLDPAERGSAAPYLAAYENKYAARPRCHRRSCCPPALANPLAREGEFPPMFPLQSGIFPG